MRSDSSAPSASPYVAPGALPGFGWGWIATVLWIVLAVICVHLMLTVAGQQKQLSDSITWWRKAEQYLGHVQAVATASSDGSFRLDREGFLEQFPPAIDAELRSNALLNVTPLSNAPLRDPVRLWSEANARFGEDLEALRLDGNASVRILSESSLEVSQHIGSTMRLVTSDMAERTLQLDANREWLYITAILAVIAAGALIVLNYRGWQKRRALVASATALQVSESRYRNMFQENRAIQMVLHPASEQILDANQAACDFYGMLLPELTAMRLPELDAAGKSSTKEPEESPGAPRQLQHRLATGELRHVEVRMSPFTVHGGQLLYVIAHDVTERFRAERALRDSEERFRTLAQNIPGVVYLCQDDARMTVEYVNRSAVELTGYAELEFLTGEVTLLELVPEEEREHVAQEIRTAVRGGTSYFVDHRLTCNDGRVRYVQQYGQLVDGAAPGVRFIEGAIFDVTERKQAQEALQAEQVRLGVTLRSMADGVFSVDTDGRIMLMNESAIALTGVPVTKAVGEPLTSVYRVVDTETGDPQTKRVERLLGGDERKPPRTMTLLRAEGEPRQVTESSAPIRTPDGDLLGHVFVIRDVTDQRRLEEQMLRAERLDSLGVLAGGIAHDFNNILAGIIGNFSLVRMHLDEPEIRDDRLSKAEAAAIRARDLTKQLLTLSKGSMPVRRTASLGELVHETAEFALRGSNVRSTIEIADDLWAASVDVGQISQVLHNLVLNADQAMADGGELFVEASNQELAADNDMALEAGPHVRLRVRDTGVGIAGENLERIFDPYFTTKAKGSGLGLASSYSIVRNHDGIITVESKPGTGTTFDVYLPVAGGEVHADEDVPVAKPRSGLHVLLMDDDSVIRDAASAMLLSTGCQVDVTETGGAAVEAYQKQLEAGAPFDLVILDLTVPGGMGGHEAMERITALDPDVRAVASSGYLNDPAMMTPRKFGFCGILPKPYTKEELTALVAQTLPAGS